ncbi:MAG: hypothetical protein CVV28_06460 [Methanobacteriales archaeon HGW-Methanobacteriales-1]|jgi:hypothetical protein|nr:hypothetical protein [Methanobacteriaceae archaeon]PKL67048.1 MAG: hypothetical protein CVV28_06460 [Methanobacteriales archaeon HGW-Methanobacteriales-1]
MLVEGPEPLFEGGHFEKEFPVDDPGLAMLAVLVGAINIAVLLLMLYVYLKSYLRLKSQFTLGLLVFVMLLILQNTIFITFLLIREGFSGPGMGVPVLTINLTQLGALIVLLKITWD